MLFSLTSSCDSAAGLSTCALAEPQAGSVRPRRTCTMRVPAAAKALLSSASTGPAT